MRLLVISGVLFLLGACGAVPQLAGIEAVGTVTTGKPFSDHLWSLYTGKDCSSIRVYNGQTYCQEDEIVPQPVLFCYRTLGTVTCYDRPDPHKGRYQKVGDNDQNLVKPH